MIQLLCFPHINRFVPSLCGFPDVTSLLYLYIVALDHYLNHYGNTHANAYLFETELGSHITEKNKLFGKVDPSLSVAV